MATIQDIANEVGISTAAVSRILNRKGSFSPETIARVEAVARKLNYSRSTPALSENTPGLNLIAVIVPNRITPYYGLLTSLMEQTAYDYGYNLMICGSQFDLKRPSLPAEWHSISSGILMI